MQRREAAETSLAQAKRALDEERQKVGPLERGLAVAHQSIGDERGKVGLLERDLARPVRPSKGLRQAQSRQRQRRLTPHGAGSLPKRLQGRLARRSHGNAKGQPRCQVSCHWRSAISNV